MRFFWWRTVRTVIAFSSVVVLVSVALTTRIPLLCRFSALEGERTFYLHSASSQAEQKNTIDFVDAFFVKGESVRFALGGRNAETFALEIARAYGAEIVYTESACGTTSFYAYAENGWESVTVQGARVNLHIAVGENVCVVGTPIIFGGF